MYILIIMFIYLYLLYFLYIYIILWYFNYINFYFIVFSICVVDIKYFRIVRFLDYVER